MRPPLAFAALALAALLLPLPAGPPPDTRHITLDARQFEFAPGRIEVNQGDQVVLRLTASDVVHGFYLDGYDVEQRVVPGVAREIRFTASAAGKFRYRCSVACGAMHPFMIGELVVNPNVPFARAAAFAALALAGLFAHLWKPERSAHEPETPHPAARPEE